MRQLAYFITLLLINSSFTFPREAKIDKEEAQKAFILLNDIRKNSKKYHEDFPFLKNSKIKKSNLSWNNQLAIVAENKALDMANRNYFSHIDLDGYGINFFIKKSGYSLNPQWTKNQSSNNFESLCAGADSGEDAISILIIDKGVPSLGHRKHLLGIGKWNSSMTDIGIGFARSKFGSDYKTYVCVIIAKHDYGRKEIKSNSLWNK